jgi:hypothetical protein
MNEIEQPLDAQSPLQRLIIVASIACFAALALVYCLAAPAVKLLEVWWAELLAYAIIPISVTFIILYRSDWRREISGAARTWSVLLLSLTIFAGVLLAVGVLSCMLWFIADSMHARGGGR